MLCPPKPPGALIRRGLPIRRAAGLAACLFALGTAGYSVPALGFDLNIPTGGGAVDRIVGAGRGGIVPRFDFRISEFRLGGTGWGVSGLATLEGYRAEAEGDHIRREDYFIVVPPTEVDPWTGEIGDTFLRLNVDFRPPEERLHPGGRMGWGLRAGLSFWWRDSEFEYVPPSDDDLEGHQFCRLGFFGGAYGWLRGGDWLLLRAGVDLLGMAYGDGGLDAACELRFSDYFVLRAEADLQDLGDASLTRYALLAEARLTPKAAVTAGWQSVETSSDDAQDSHFVVCGPIVGMVFTF